MFSLESPHKAILMSTHNLQVSNIKKKITFNYLKSAAIGLFPREPRMSSTEILLYRYIKKYWFIQR